MTNSNRIYKCKDEELVLIATFTHFSFKRDVADFSAFSPKYNTEFATQLEAQVELITNLVQPSTEILAKKIITNSIDTICATCSAKAQHLEGYLLIAKAQLPVSKNDFGLVAWRKAINKADIEAIINSLDVVIQNIEANLPALKAAGMSDQYVADLKTAHTQLASNRQQQFEIDSNRQAIVQNNLSALNDLFAQLKELYAIGKILYYNTNKAKYKEYTFTELLKKVKQTTKTTPTLTKTN